MQLALPGFSFSQPSALVLMLIFFGLSQSLFWMIFVLLLSRFPFWLYPLLTTFVNILFISLIGRILPNIIIKDVPTAIWLIVGITANNTLIGALFSLDRDSWFDRNVTQRMVKNTGSQIKTPIPGFLFLEIDGLSETLLKRAVEKGKMPTLERWLQNGSHKILGWETDFSSQTGAMQAGILMGNNRGIPAYRWWDRQKGRLVVSGLPSDAKYIEETLSDGSGLCSNGGASRGNMFSGDAAESLFTISTMLNPNRSRGPGFYFYLVNPYVIIRLLTRFFLEVFTEWAQAFWQRVKRYPYRVSSRNFFYSFIRGFMSPLLQDLSTYATISDMVRGLPAIYVLYAGYDDISHYAGMHSVEAYNALYGIDEYLARIEKTLQFTPRPYHIVVLSDHGQSFGKTFKSAHGLNLDDLVGKLINKDVSFLAAMDTNEAWDNLNALINESIYTNSRTAKMIQRTLSNKMRSGAIQLGPERKMSDRISAAESGGQVLVLASGCAGLIYFTDSKQRLTYEQIQDSYPELIFGLINHTGIGFVLVKSELYGAMVIGKAGVHYLSDDKIEGIDPLQNYGHYAHEHLKRQSSFENCPDLLVNSVFDPITQEISAFENQVSHHGGLGGLQNYPFLFYPSGFEISETPIIGAQSVYRILRKWREGIQNDPLIRE